MCVVPKLTARNEIKVKQHTHNIVSIKIETINSKFAFLLFVEFKRKYVQLVASNSSSGITFKFVKICTMNGLEWHEYVYVCSGITLRNGWGYHYVVVYVIVAINAACYLFAWFSVPLTLPLALYVFVNVVFPYNLMLNCCKKKMRPAFTHTHKHKHNDTFRCCQAHASVVVKRLRKLQIEGAIQHSNICHILWPVWMWIPKKSCKCYRLSNVETKTKKICMQRQDVEA